MPALYLWIICVAWLAIGVFVGTVSYYLPPGHHSGGWLANSGFGVLGSVGGGLATTFTIGGMMAPPQGAVAGALAVVVLWRVLRPTTD